LSELDPALTEVSRKVIGCAIEVHKGLGPGYDEEVYQKALGVELKAAGVGFETQRAFPVTYRGQSVGNKIADLYVDNRFVVEVLAHRGEVGAAERAGVRALLRAGDMELGLIINFAERRLKDGLVRVLNPEKLGLNQPHDAGHDGPTGAAPEGGHEHA
jgi:GxxExxY protein